MSGNATMRIAIMGTGGTGGYFGALLARAGEEVTFIARGAHLDAIRAHGLTVKSAQHGDFTLRVEATDDPGTLGPVDVILFCVKTYDTEAAAARIRHLVGPGTMVLSVQNGIESPDQLARLLGARAMVGAAAYVSATIESPGVIAHHALGRIVIGELDGGESARIGRLRAMFERAGIEVKVHPQIRVAMWEKFIAICGLSGMTALTRLPVGAILACAESAELYRQALAEVEAVARARGIDVAADIVEKGAMPKFPGIYGSMYHDLVAGRRLELDALNGAVVRLAHGLGVSVPVNAVIHAALKPYVAGAPSLP